MGRGVIITVVLLLELSLIAAAGWVVGSVSRFAEQFGAAATGATTSPTGVPAAAVSGSPGEAVPFTYRRYSDEVVGTITVTTAEWKFSGDDDAEAGLHLDVTITTSEATTTLSENDFRFIDANGEEHRTEFMGGRSPDFPGTVTGAATRRGWLRFDVATAPGPGTLLLQPFVATSPVVAIAIAGPSSVPSGQPVKPGTKVNFDVRTATGERLRGTMTVYDSDWTLEGGPRKAWLYADIGITLTEGEMDVYYHAFSIEQGERSETGSVLAGRTPRISGMTVSEGKPIRGWVNFDVQRADGKLVLKDSITTLATIAISGD